MFYKRKMNTSAMIAGIRNKNQEAFISLYNCYAPALMGIIAREVKNANVSAEILEDVFIKIWQKIHSYDAAKNTLFTWMLQITHHACKDHFLNKLHIYENLFTRPELEIIQSKYLQPKNEDLNRRHKAFSIANANFGAVEPKKFSDQKN